MLKKSLFTIVLILSIFCLGGCDMEEQKDVGVEDGTEKMYNITIVSPSVGVQHNSVIVTYYYYYNHKKVQGNEFLINYQTKTIQAVDTITIDGSRTGLFGIYDINITSDSTIYCDDFIK